MSLNPDGVTREKPKFRQYWQISVKILELLFCCLCIAFVMEPAKKGDLARIHLDHFAVILPTFIGYLIITFIFLLARVIGDKIPYRTGFMFSLAATGMFFISGILLALDRKRHNYHDEFFYMPRPHVLQFLAISTSFSFFTAIIYGVEAFFIWKLKEDF